MALMYLMYVDESGDCGMPADGSQTPLFCLSGVVVHELCWREVLSELIDFRRWLWGKYNVFQDDEIHAGDMISKPTNLPPSLRVLNKHTRLAIVRHFADTIAKLQNISIINVVVDKRNGHAKTKDEVFRWAWYSLFQRFENTIRQKNFPGSKNNDDRGLIFPDNTDGQKLRQFLNKMQVTNPLKIKQQSGSFIHIDEPIKLIVENPVMRDSRESYIVQVADCAVFLLKQSIEPSAYMKKHGGNAYLTRLDPVLCKHASKKIQRAW
jgi:hypothetical protein